MDLFLQTPLGLSALAYALTGYLIGILQGGLLRSAWWVSPLLGGLGGILGGLSSSAIGALVGQEQLFTLRRCGSCSSPAVYDAIVAADRSPFVPVGGRERERAYRGEPTAGQDGGRWHLRSRFARPVAH